MWLAFEGTDGAGKTTLSKRMVARGGSLPNRRVEVLPEFSSTAVGDLIRQRIGERYFFQLGLDGHLPIGETLVLAADLALQFEALQRRQQSRHNILVSDRGPLSLVIYQALRIAQHASGINEAAATHWIQHLWGLLPQPDLTVVLYVPEKELRQRLRERQPDLPDASISFILAVQQRYLAAVEASDDQRHMAVCNTDSPDAVIHQIACLTNCL